eukprot:gnl/TRDRNA2_/TRDRNA2_198569_c0_seq1.p1 gnl/TRDRNA2_/TRDRNA2_198569_c0~~gnl/TRDRNA2_/TRDRNA2_198569_c0_seq1.p1  ORF type:complete len:165 (-),score=23.54 gnl/TRDRNA2_/TRDRNA2_198569_c0_seq1:51-545(-)
MTARVSWVLWLEAQLMEMRLAFVCWLCFLAAADGTLYGLNRGNEDFFVPDGNVDFLLAIYLLYLSFAATFVFSSWTESTSLKAGKGRGKALYSFFLPLLIVASGYLRCQERLWWWMNNDMFVPLDSAWVVCTVGLFACTILIILKELLLPSGVNATAKVGAKED